MVSEGIFIKSSLHDDMFKNIRRENSDALK